MATLQLPDTLALEDGTRVRIRRARPGDQEEMQEMIEAFDHLSSQSRYLRFFSATPRLTENLLRQLTAVDGHEHVAIVAEEIDSGTPPRGLGVARFIRSPGDRSSAELALTVIDEMQHHGLGRILMAYLASEAVGEGVTYFLATVLPENRAMHTLIRGVAPGATSTLEEGMECYRIPLQGIDLDSFDLATFVRQPGSTS